MEVYNLLNMFDIKSLNKLMFAIFIINTFTWHGWNVSNYIYNVFGYLPLKVIAKVGIGICN